MKFRPLLLAIGLSLSLGAVAAPKVIKKVPPEFPGEAARKGVNAGTVRARLTIEADGKVSNVEILDAEPRRVFDKASIAALMEWRFDTGGQKETFEIKLVFRNDE